MLHLGASTRRRRAKTHAVHGRSRSVVGVRAARGDDVMNQRLGEFEQDVGHGIDVVRHGESSRALRIKSNDDVTGGWSMRILESAEED